MNSGQSNRYCNAVGVDGDYVRLWFGFWTFDQKAYILTKLSVLVIAGLWTECQVAPRSHCPRSCRSINFNKMLRMFGRLHSDTGNMLLCKEAKLSTSRNNTSYLVHLRQNGHLFMIAIVLSWLIFFSFCYNEFSWNRSTYRPRDLTVRLNIATFVAVMTAGMVKFIGRETLNEVQSWVN